MLYLLEVLSILLTVVLIVFVIKHFRLQLKFNKSHSEHVEETKKLTTEIQKLKDLEREEQKQISLLLEEIRKYERGEYESI